MAFCSFFLRKVAHSALMLLCVSVLALAVVKATPGDYFDTARVDPRIAPDALEAMRAREGLHDSFPVFYWRWLRSCARGDWGFSFAYNIPASRLLIPRVRNTLLLALCATLLAWAVALPAGIAAGIREGKAIDFLITAATTLLLAIPEVILALIALLLAARLHWLSFATGPFSSGRLFFPTVCLSASLVPLLALHIKASVAETAHAPFVGAARGLGITARRVLLRWILPASSNPAISLFGLSLGLLMSSSLIVEGVFSWPGLGQLMLQAISDRDMFLIADSAVIAAGFLLMGNLVADALLYISDPRIRTQ